MTQPAIKRILVAIDTDSRGTTVVEMAATLASRLNAPLHGLFVEDINLLRLAALPFAREIGFSSAAEQRLDWNDVERFFRKQSLLAEQALAEIAQRMQVPWSFQVTRGLPLAAPLDLMEATDLIVFGKDGEITDGPVVALFDGTPAAQQTLALAARLAEISGKTLTLLLPQQDAATLRPQAEEALRNLNCQAAFLPLLHIDPAHLARVATDANATTLVLPGDPQSFGSAKIRMLLDGIGCPLVLVA